MGYKVVGVTACIMGVAHTYMSAESLEKFCKKDPRFDSVHVETQGSIGVENKLKKDWIEEADIVILTNEIHIKERERFDNKIVHEINGDVLIKYPAKVMDEAIKKYEEKYPSKL